MFRILQLGADASVNPDHCSLGQQAPHIPVWSLDRGSIEIRKLGLPENCLQGLLEQPIQAKGCMRYRKAAVTKHCTLGPHREMYVRLNDQFSMLY